MGWTMDILLFQYLAYLLTFIEDKKPGRGMIEGIYSDTSKHSELVHLQDNDSHFSNR